MRRLLLLLGLVAGCAGYPEAQRSAAQMADATDAYLRETGRRLSDEQAHYERARAEQDAALRRERDARAAVRPLPQTIELVEKMIREDGALRRPGDLYEALLSDNARREAAARDRAAERAALRRAYSESLARLEEKRSDLVRLRSAFEALAAELSIEAKVAYIERLAIHARDVMRSSAGAPEPER